MFCISPLYKEVLIIFFYMQALRSNNYFYINLLSVRLLNKKFTVRLVNNRFISIRRYFSSFPSRSLFTINYIPVSSLPPVFTSYELIAKSFSTSPLLSEGSSVANGKGGCDGKGDGNGRSKGIGISKGVGVGEGKGKGKGKTKGKA